MRDAWCGGDSFLLIGAPSIRVESSTGALSLQGMFGVGHSPVREAASGSLLLDYH
jgi:hypothetical protein